MSDATARPSKTTQQAVGVERVTDAQLDALIVLAEHADGMWGDESSHIALAGWRELKALRALLAASREALEFAVYVIDADAGDWSDHGGNAQSHREWAAQLRSLAQSGDEPSKAEG